MGMDRWDRRDKRTQGDLFFLSPLFASGSFSRRHPVCSPRLAERVADAGSRLLPAGPVACIVLSQQSLCPSICKGGLCSSALPPVALTMSRLSVVLTLKARVPAHMSSCA